MAEQRRRVPDQCRKHKDVDGKTRAAVPALCVRSPTVSPIERRVLDFDRFAGVRIAKHLDHILIAHADAPVGNGFADFRGDVASVDAVSSVEPPAVFWRKNAIQRTPVGLPGKSGSDSKWLR